MRTWLIQFLIGADWPEEAPAVCHGMRASFGLPIYSALAATCLHLPLVDACPYLYLHSTGALPGICLQLPTTTKTTAFNWRPACTCLQLVPASGCSSGLIALTKLSCNLHSTSTHMGTQAHCTSPVLIAACPISLLCMRLTKHGHRSRQSGACLLISPVCPRIHT